MRSWDSHAHYQDFQNEDEEDEDGLGGGREAEGGDNENPDGGLFPSRPSSIICYCDMSTFKTPRTILRVLLVVSDIFYLVHFGMVQGPH